MNLSVKKMVRSGVLAGVATLLMFIEIPMAFLAPWLKLDVSLVPVLLAGFGMGPFWAALVQIAKSLLHMTMTQTGGVGELADIIVGLSMMLPTVLIYRWKHTRKRALIGMGVGVLFMIVAAALTNYFLLVPMYFGGDAAGGIARAMQGSGSAVNSMGTYVTLAVIPFNIIKGVLVSVLTYLLYKPLRRFLHD